MQNIIAPKARPLKSDDVRVRKRFQQSCKQYIKRHKLDKVLYDLQQTITTLPSQQDEQKFNKIMAMRNKRIQVARWEESHIVKSIRH
jgi:hypothetical protein